MIDLLRARLHAMLRSDDGDRHVWVPLVRRGANAANDALDATICSASEVVAPAGGAEPTPPPA